MKRIGLYDAIDKWEILSRYWEDRDSVHTIVDGVDKPLIPKWHRAAMMRGEGLGLEYLTSRTRAPRPALPPESAIAAHAGAAPPLEVELTRLVSELGVPGLQARYRQLAAAISTSGFAVPFDGGLSPALVDRLKQIFKQGAIEGLHWTGDDGEVPSLPVLRYWRGPHFPSAVLQGKQRALDMFSCRFFGRADVIHIHDGGVPTVTLVDNDAAKMADMRLIFPSHWTYVVSDYKDFLADAVRSGQSYDLVVADPWLVMAPQIAWDMLPAIMSICSDTFMTNYSDSMFEELKVAPDNLSGLSQAVSERAGTRVAFARVEPRSKPVYWAVMRKVASA